MTAGIVCETETQRVSEQNAGNRERRRSQGTFSVKMFPKQVCSPHPNELYASRGRLGSMVSGLSNV